VRSEILEITAIFGGKVVDVGPGGLSVALAGDPGKLFAFEQIMRPFGLSQLARTGRITLQRSDESLDLAGLMPFQPDPNPMPRSRISSRAPSQPRLQQPQRFCRFSDDMKGVPQFAHTGNVT
jgi:hypothetical protein